MQLYFIRHGQSGNNLLWERTGSNAGRSFDPELSEVGKQQADLLASFILDHKLPSGAKEGDFQNSSGFNLSHIYTSLMVRAVSTASPLAQKLCLPLVAWKDLHETGGIYRENKEKGEFIGLPANNRSYFETNFPDLVLPENLGSEGWWNRPFETLEERLPRAKRVVEEMLLRHGDTDDRVAIVSHGGFYQYLMAVILGSSQDKTRTYALNNTAITRVDFSGSEITLVYMNRLDFLPSDLIT